MKKPTRMTSAAAWTQPFEIRSERRCVSWIIASPTARSHRHMRARIFQTPPRSLASATPATRGRSGLRGRPSRAGPDVVEVELGEQGLVGDQPRSAPPAGSLRGELIAPTPWSGSACGSPQAALGRRARSYPVRRRAGTGACSSPRHQWGAKRHWCNMENCGNWARRRPTTGGHGPAERGSGRAPRVPCGLGEGFDWQELLRWAVLGLKVVTLMRAEKDRWRAVQLLCDGRRRMRRRGVPVVSRSRTLSR